MKFYRYIISLCVLALSASGIGAATRFDTKPLTDSLYRELAIVRTRPTR